MTLELVGYKTRAESAIREFWCSRDAAMESQRQSGRLDIDGRTGAVAGKNLDAFGDLFEALVTANGLPDAQVHRRRAVLTLPGYFRPTKLWDLLVVHHGELIAAIELKSQVGPSFGNNFNNRTEEAIGTGHDLWTAYREGAFGAQPKPFVGWLMLVEDAPESRRAVKDAAPHFAVNEAFVGASYLQRYDILCQRLMKERIYTAATVLASPRSAATSGTFSDMSKMTGLKAFVAALAGHVASASARHAN